MGRPTQFTLGRPTQPATFEAQGKLFNKSTTEALLTTLSMEEGIDLFDLGRAQCHQYLQDAFSKVHRTSKQQGHSAVQHVATKFCEVLPKFATSIVTFILHIK